MATNVLAVLAAVFAVVYCCRLCDGKKPDNLKEWVKRYGRKK